MASKQMIEKCLYLLVTSYPWFEITNIDITVATWEIAVGDFSDEVLEQAVKNWIKFNEKDPVPSQLRLECEKSRAESPLLEWRPPKISKPEKLSKEETTELLKKAGFGKYQQ